MAAVPPVRIENRVYALQPNPKENPQNDQGVIEYKPRNLWEKISEYQKTGYGGIFRTGQFLERIAKVINHWLQSEGLKNLGAMFSKIWTGSVIARIPEVVNDMTKAHKNLSNPTTDATFKAVKVMTWIDKGTDAVSTFGYITSMVLFCFKQTVDWAKSILKTADTVTFVGDMNQSAMYGLFFNKCRIEAIKVQSMNVGDDVKAHFADSRNYYLMKTLKAICSVAGFILGLVLATTGIAMVSGVVLMGLSLSLASNMLAMSADFYSAGMKYEPIKPFDEKHVQILVEGQ